MKIDETFKKLLKRNGQLGFLLQFKGHNSKTLGQCGWLSNFTVVLGQQTLSSSLKKIEEVLQKIVWSYELCKQITGLGPHNM